MKRALLSAVLAALATAAVLATIGFGASSKSGKARSTQDQQSAQTQSGPPPTMKEALAKMQSQRDAQQKKLADAIGVSTSDLQAAQDNVRKQHLDAQVKANELTQDQEDAILACEKAPLTCDRSNLPAGGPRGRHGFGRDGDGASGYAKDLAAALGVDEAKVTSALQSTRPQRPQGDGFGRGGHGPGGPMGGPGMGGPGMEHGDGWDRGDDWNRDDHGKDGHDGMPGRNSRPGGSDNSDDSGSLPAPAPTA